MRKKIWIVFSVLLVLSLALAGCGQKITAEEIVAKVQETFESTQDAHAIVTANVNVQGIEMSVTAEVWERSPNKLRVVVLEASESRLVGTIMVSDGQQGWYYEPARNVVMVGPASEIETPLPQEMIGEFQKVIQEVLDISDVKLVGEEAVAGREAYKLTLSSKEGEGPELFPGDGTATLWVDKEQWIVLKATYEAETIGQGSMEVQSFELNPGLADELFTFQVPEGVKVVDAEAQQPVPLTLDEARTQAAFPLLVPEYVPQGVTLVEVFRVDESFVLRYDHSPQVSFTVIQGSGVEGPLPLGSSLTGSYPAEEVTVRDQSATLITDEVGGNTLLYWTENGVTVTVAGHISLDEALKVAESLR